MSSQEWGLTASSKLFSAAVGLFRARLLSNATRFIKIHQNTTPCLGRLAPWHTLNILKLSSQRTTLSSSSPRRRGTLGPATKHL